MLLMCPYCLEFQIASLGRKNKHDILKTDRSNSNNNNNNNNNNNTNSDDNNNNTNPVVIDIVIGGSISVNIVTSIV